MMTAVRQDVRERQAGRMRRLRRSRLRINRGRFLVTLLVLVSALLYCAGLVFASDEPSVPVVYKEVTVKPGDTLWKLAREHGEAAGLPVRELVDVLKELNDAEDAVLVPGQIVRIPLARR